MNPVKGYGRSVRGPQRVLVGCLWLAGALSAAAQGPSVFARVSGTVEDADGALVPGAQVTLVAGGANLQSVSGSDGRFVFTEVPAGAFRVIANEDGMEQGECAGTVEPQQVVELDP
ncbi:MAG TPA: carboxypeptidase-like regulatory domain-containing protein, partial [Acidobacteriaceae bacterium]|nr:carboxypeptidase-like regulatory domain-containing protein [Acidobacteriaceae bacterium]